MESGRGVERKSGKRGEMERAGEREKGTEVKSVK